VALVADALQAGEGASGPPSSGRMKPNPRSVLKNFTRPVGMQLNRFTHTPRSASLDHLVGAGEQSGWHKADVFLVAPSWRAKRL
jgi:hypothetical protein